MTPEPNISVSTWTPWANRDSGYFTDWDWEAERNVEYGGVYVLGHFASVPPENITPHLDEGVVYIGKTQHLRTRPRKQHDKVKDRYRSEFRDDGLERLYLALYAMTDCFYFRPPESAFLSYLERRLLWEYAQRWGKLPALNNC